MGVSLGKGVSTPFIFAAASGASALSTDANIIQSLAPLTQSLNGILDAVTFFRVRADGITDKIASSGATGPSGSEDTSRGIVSLWFDQPIGASAREDLITLGSADNSRFTIHKQTDQTIRLQMFDASQNELLTLDADTTVSSDGQTHHLWSSWQTNTLGSAGNDDYRMWLDGSDVTEYVTQSSANASADVEYTVPWIFLGRDAGDFFFNGRVAEFYFAPGQFLDPTVTANVEKFRNVAGSAISLGVSGKTPTGSEPAVYFTGGVSGWHINKGAIADTEFSLIGALASAGAV